MDRDGLALAPVESIRRRVDAIAASDLSQRVPRREGTTKSRAWPARSMPCWTDSKRPRSSSRNSSPTRVTNCEVRSHAARDDRTSAKDPITPIGTKWVSRHARGPPTRNVDRRLAWLARHDEHRAEIHSVDVDLDDLLLVEGHRVRLLSELSVDTTMVRPTRVTGDPAMLKRMIRNVVDNATRYATEELRFDSHYDGDEAVVIVADDGDGIDVSQSDRFFERFVRSDPARAVTPVVPVWDSRSSPRLSSVTAARRASPRPTWERGSNCVSGGTGESRPEG